MAVWTPHSLFTFGGILNTDQSPSEIWQCGVRVGATGAGGQLADPDAFLTELVTPMHDWFQNNGMMPFPTSCQLTWMKCAQIGVDGHYTDAVAHVHDFAPALVGTRAPTIPDLLAVAVSWKTAIAIRKHSYASHGRVYLPLYDASPETSGSVRINATDQANCKLLGVALLNAINNVTQPAVPIVASPHAAEVNVITGVRVGNVLDVQRRRKDAVKEVYVEASFP